MHDTIVVIKIGSNILTTEEGKLDLNNLRGLINQMTAELSKDHFKIIVVTSGAIACGSEKIQCETDTIPERQASASVGQILLMNEYATFFGFKGFSVGQILLTKEDFINPVTRRNVRNTISTLLSHDVVPIINENDSVATDEIDYRFDDNDDLSSRVAILVNAKRLLLLTDTEGLYTANPQKSATASLIDTVETITDAIVDLTEVTQSRKSRGGMRSKILSAKRAQQEGIEVIIANGRRKDVIHSIFANEKIGTRILPQK